MPYVLIHVDFDDFDDDDLKEELESRGYTVSKHGISTNSLGDLGHVEHLMMCGQVNAAKAEALAMVSKAIGRTLQ